MSKTSLTTLRALGRFTVLVSAFLPLVGCHVGSHRTGTPVATLRYALTIEPPTLDPVVNSSAANGEMLQNVFEGLVTLDTNTRVAPCLADRWKISPDGLTYTFHLDPKATFHPPFRRPVTASDVKYSLERALWPQTKAPYAAVNLEPVLGSKAVIDGKRTDLAGVKVLDEHTVAISLQHPAAYFLVELAGISVVCREAIERTGGQIDVHSAVGTGPFRLIEYRPQTRVVLEADPGYYGGAPRLLRIERPIVLNADTARQKYLVGELDLCLESQSDYANDAHNATMSAQTHLVPLSRVDYLVMHQTLKPLFRDRRVRQALAYAIDRDALVRIAYHGLARRANGFLPVGVLGYTPNLRDMPYDPAQARALLAQAGYPAGRGFPALQLVYQQGSPSFAAMAQLIRNDLQNGLGITVQLEQREAGTFFSDTDNDRVAFYLVGWQAVDPYDFLSTLLKTGRKGGSGYSNPQVDALCNGRGASGGRLSSSQSDRAG
jgi:ABC-type transport system substrate-binding protein